LRLKTNERTKTVWGHASTYDSLLHHEASRAMISQFCLKIGEGATTGGAHDVIAEAAWKSRERWSVRWCQVRRSGSRTKPPLIRCNFSFSPQGHSNLLIITINRTIGMLWEASSPTPLDLGLHFAKVWVCFMF
jgi:hypothetical protein